MFESQIDILFKDKNELLVELKKMKKIDVESNLEFGKCFIGGGNCERLILK